MFKLLRFMKGYKKESILGPFFKMLEVVFELMVPLIVANIVDIGIKGNNNTAYIFKMSLLLVLFGLIGLTSTLAAQYFAAKAAVGFASKVRFALFEHIGRLSYTELDSVGTSTLITRMTSDINQVQQGINLTLRLFLRSPFIVFGALIMAFTVDAKAALWFVIVIPVLSIVVFGIMLVSIPLYKKVQGGLDRVVGLTRSGLSGARVVRAFCTENRETQEFEDRNNNLAETQKFVGRISALMNPLTYVIINLAVIALIYTGAIRVEAGVITQGAVIALYNYMSQILVELIKLANLIINITKSVASGNRIQSVFEIESSQTESGNAVVLADAGAIEFKNVSMKYKGAAENSLQNISFSVKKGETVGIIGGTGSGKSTLVNMIPRFYDSSEGELHIGGVNVKDWDTEALREKIAVVPQKAVLFKGTIRENLLWGSENATDDDIYFALETAQALDVVMKKEDKLDHLIEQSGRNLSGGQRQRLTIARALVKKPQILILDDSSSALDYATDSALRKAIAESTEGMTVFIVSQRASSVMNADKIIVLDDGEAVGIGTHEELLATCDIYNEIYHSQFKKGVEK
ncbi:MAG: ABC transporter ATP-binding protein [Clostridia bacterium]|nr:ABC transporter ATP-binding protein [Clostridia bacterium]